MAESIRHLPKAIDESADRLFAYETLWKRVALDLLVRHVGCQLTGLSLLDYGCGRGEMLAMAARQGMQVTGTDLDPECVKLSRKHGDAKMLVEPHDPLRQFGAGNFDVVSCLHVLEHVVRPKEVLASLAQIARRHLIVAVPNLRSLPTPRFLRSEQQAVNEGHLQGWDHAHFRNLAERHCGLRLIGWGHDQVRVPVLSALAYKLGGDPLAIRFETGLFLKLAPFHCTSIIALLEVAR